MSLGSVLLYVGLAVTALSAVVGGAVLLCLRARYRRLQEQLVREYGPQDQTKTA